MNCGVWGLCGVVVEGEGRKERREADCAILVHVVDVNW